MSSELVNEVYDQVNDIVKDNSVSMDNKDYIDLLDRLINDFGVMKLEAEEKEDFQQEQG